MDYPECSRLTFCGILVAFLELAFAYCLLCVSSFVFITSKLLLFLPCLGYLNTAQNFLFDWSFTIILRIQRMATTRTGRRTWHQDGSLNNKDLAKGLMEKVKLLQRAVEEERAARAALMVELEEERAASASAADEAMAMILRLQADKASLEMEGKQYERMIEEKFAYDEEEMNILKEILLKREKEKHFLEKELETYKHVDDTHPEIDDREPIVYDVHVVDDKNDDAKMRDDDDVAEHKEMENDQMKQMEDIVKQLREMVKDHDSSPSSSSLHIT